MAPDAAPPHRTVVANLVLLTAIVCIGGLTPVAARDAMAGLPPLSTGLVRFGTAALLLQITRYLWQRRDVATPIPIARRDWPRLLWAAALCVPLNQICFLLGVKLANASHAGLFYALNPVLVFLLTLLLGRTAWSARMGVAAALAFGGAAIIAWEGFYVTTTRSFFVGDLLLFGAILTWSGYTVVSVPLAARYGPLRTLSLVLTIGSFMYLPAWLVDGHQFLHAEFTPRVLGGFLYITLITSYINYLLWFVALTRVDVNQLAIATNTAPLIAVVGAYYWHHEPLTDALLGGGTLLLVAITLANWHRLRQLARPCHGKSSSPTSSAG